MFKGYDMAKLYFEMTPNILPNMEYQYVNCEVAYEINMKNP